MTSRDPVLVWKDAGDGRVHGFCPRTKKLRVVIGEICSEYFGLINARLNGHDAAQGAWFTSADAAKEWAEARFAGRVPERL